MVSKEKLQYQKEYTNLNKDIINQKQRLKYLNNKKDILERNENWRQLNKEKVALKKRENYLKNRDLILEKSKLHRLNNLKTIREKDNIRNRVRRPKTGRIAPGLYSITVAERNINKWINEELTIYHLKIVDDDDTVFYKYGLTRNIKIRLEKIPYKVEILKTITIDKYEAIYLEKTLLTNIKKYTPIKKFGGYTECFIK